MIPRADSHILDQINAYDGSLPQLGRLIAGLDAVWELHSDWPETRRKDFRFNWGVLEQIYAEALDKQFQRLSAQDILDSRTALSLLKEQLMII